MAELRAGCVRAVVVVAVREGRECENNPGDDTMRVPNAGDRPKTADHMPEVGQMR